MSPTSELFDRSPDAVIAVDRERRIVALSREAQRLFGYTRDELIGRPLETLILGRLKEMHARERADHLTPPEALLVEHGRVMRKDGSEVSVDIALTPMQNEGSTIWFCTVRDASRNTSESATARRLRFEETRADLSARLIKAAPNEIDAEIVRGLKAVCEVLGADRAGVALYQEDSGDFLITHRWAAEKSLELSKRFVREFLPNVTTMVLRGEHLIANIRNMPPGLDPEAEYMRSVGIKMAMIVPYRVGERIIGGMSCDAFRAEQPWDEFTIVQFQATADIIANALARREADEKLRNAFEEIRRLHARIEQENKYLRTEAEFESSQRSVVGNSHAIKAVLKLAEQVARTDSTVLILGETGTGKELLAKTIHEISVRNRRTMIKTNCAALPATLIESELFGREKGAYTGALVREIGRFELADHSTVFLDEIGELPLELQPKLLRVLQEGDFERLGSPKTIHVNVRVIAATSRNLEQMVNDGKFREDLFYRLNVFPIVIPPLRERMEDIPALVWHILRNLERRMGRSIESVDPATMRRFQNYAWPGNVRELINVIERNLILNPGSVFRAYLPESMAPAEPATRRLDEIEADHVRRVLQSTQWRVRGDGGAAQILGLKPTTLEARLKKLGINRPS